LNNSFLLAAYTITCLFLGGANAVAQGAQEAQEAIDATPDYSGAAAIIDGFHQNLIDIMKRSDELGHAGRAKELYPVLNVRMNVKALGIGAVGRRNWGQWDPTQQEQFIETFTRSMASTYASRFKAFNGQNFIVTGHRQGPKSSVIIMTEVESPLRETTSIHYLMINKGSKWAIADIFLDGAISEVAMRRSEFSSILRNDGFDGLIEAIEQKTAARSSP